MLRVGSLRRLQQHAGEENQIQFIDADEDASLIPLSIAVGGMSELRDGADVLIRFGQSADEGDHLLWHIEDAGGKQTPCDIIVVVGGLLPL
jgi:hypothetical protein